MAQTARRAGGKPERTAPDQVELARPAEKLQQVVLRTDFVFAQRGARGQDAQLRMIGMEAETIIEDSKDVAHLGPGRAAIGMQLVNHEMKDVGGIDSSHWRVWSKMGSSTSRISMIFSML